MPKRSNSPYGVLLDANIWITERLLQSSMGSAFLYALSRANAWVILPEIVEREVMGVLPDQAERAVERITKDVSLLKQLSGDKLLITVPSELAIREGINNRWKQLEGLLRQVPFAHEHAQAALERIIKKLPPCGSNNEQFRDCCIWEVAREAVKSAAVYLITNDTAFYEGGDRTRGLANSLRRELDAGSSELKAYPSIREFLSSTGETAISLDEGVISTAILEAVIPKAREIAQDRDVFELGQAAQPRISGYATPKSSILAVSFEVVFDLRRTEVADAQSGGSMQRFVWRACVPMTRTLLKFRKLRSGNGRKA